MDEAISDLVSMPVLVGLEAGMLEVGPHRSSWLIILELAGNLSKQETKESLLWKGKELDQLETSIHRKLDQLACPPSAPNINGQVTAIDNGLHMKKQTCRKKEEALAKTGWPEMSAEFTKQVKDWFMLRGLRTPGDQLEGGKEGIQNPKLEMVTEVADTANNIPILLKFLDSNEVLAAVKGHYPEDMFFKMVLDTPTMY